MRSINDILHRVARRELNPEAAEQEIQDRLGSGFDARVGESYKAGYDEGYEAARRDYQEAHDPAVVDAEDSFAAEDAEQAGGDGAFIGGRTEDEVLDDIFGEDAEPVAEADTPDIVGPIAEGEAQA